MFPVNIKLLWIALTAPPLIQRLMNSVFPDRVMLVLFTTSAEVVMEGTVN